MVSRRLHKALQRAQETKSILRIERKPKFADRVDGIVLRIGEQWILMAQTADGGYFDGYVLLRLRDVARLTPDETFAHEFVRFQPEWPPSFPFDVCPSFPFNTLPTWPFAAFLPFPLPFCDPGSFP